MSEATQKNVPALRFPEFSGEWEKKHLKEINTQMQSGLSRLLKDEDIGLPVIRSNNIIDGKLDTSDIKYWYKEDPQGANTQNYLLAEGDLLINFINSIAQIGKVALYENKLNRDAIITTNLMRLKFTDIVNTRFIFYFFLTEKYKLYIQSITKPAVNQASFTTKELEKLLILLPKTPEQKKIASFLSAMDEKIEQITRKKELLEQYKKGMMQKIFKQKIRFKDVQGKEFPDWEEKRLGDNKVAIIYDGTHQTPKYVKNGVPFYSVEHVTANQFSETKYISEEVFEQETKRIKMGDILMTRIGSIGVAKFIDWDVRASFYVSLALIKSSSGVNSKYLAQYIMSEFFQRELWKRTIHVAFPIKINLGEIGNCLVRFPHPNEQQKIADFLSSLDDKIDLIATELSQTQTFKKGLLQRMFV